MRESSEIPEVMLFQRMAADTNTSLAEGIETNNRIAVKLGQTAKW
jgi:hypothetical protein